MVAELGGPADLLENPDAHLPRAPHDRRRAARARRDRHEGRRPRRRARRRRARRRPPPRGRGRRPRRRAQRGRRARRARRAGRRPLAVVHARTEADADAAIARAARGVHRRRRGAGRAARDPRAPERLVAAVAMVPKAELHVHLEGTAPPDLVRRIAERNGLRVPEGVFATPDRFAWRDFLDFLQTYDMAASVIRTRRGLPRHHLRVPRVVRRRGRDLRRADRLARPRGARRPLRRGAHRAGSPPGSTPPAPTHGIEARILLDLHPQLRRRAGAADRDLRRRAAAPVRRRLPDGGRRGRLPARPVRRGLRRRGRGRPGLQRPRGRVGRGRERARGARPARDPDRPRRARDRGPGARRGDRRAGARPRVLPDEQRRPRRLRRFETHPLPPSARPASASPSRPTTRPTSARASAASTRSRASASA